ncbi:hypothetical protein [Cognatilysobacter terrigena]|uniref:hypothetical protein n=1 Tax=Cognatilysobacter terrigena TaxID=2488749 RepID=UPI00105CCE86|nr:hypothetical protein [Lysobacter terrigena]
MRPARQHAHQHAQSRLRERRERLAGEAARLMAESGIADYHQAKLKAAERLGIHDDASLPRNTEIEAALRQYQRLFGRDNAGELRRRREAAIEALGFFRAFDPRLVGPVLEGTSDARSPVMLHLHADDAESVHRFLVEHDVPAQSRNRRLRLDRHRDGDFPVWVFSADGLAFDVTVLPHDVLRQAPLSPVDEKPMRRANVSQLRQLVAEAEIEDFERGLG